MDVKFRVLYQTDWKYKFRGFVDIEVFPNAAMLSAALIDENCTFTRGGPKSGKTKAMMEPIIGGIVFAKMYFNEEDLDVRSIVHECVHVTEEWMKRARTNREEAKAYGTERLVMKTIKGILRRGGHIFLDADLQKSLVTLK
jgi:hypothetical protein